MMTSNKPQLRYILHRVIEMHVLDAHPDTSFPDLLAQILHNLHDECRRNPRLAAENITDSEVVEIVRAAAIRRPGWFLPQPYERRQGGLHRMIAAADRAGDVTESGS